MLQPVEDPTVEQVDVAWRSLKPVENPRQSSLQAGAADSGREPTQFKSEHMHFQVLQKKLSEE